MITSTKLEDIFGSQEDHESQVFNIAEKSVVRVEGTPNLDRTLTNTSVRDCSPIIFDPQIVDHNRTQYNLISWIRFFIPID